MVNNVLLFSTVQSDELSLQKKLRTEVIQLEDTLAQVRKEYEMLRIEFEQNLAANEQAGTFRNTPSYLWRSLGREKGNHATVWRIYIYTVFVNIGKSIPLSRDELYIHCHCTNCAWYIINIIMLLLCIMQLRSSFTAPDNVE